ncbi:hypothetical protein [uncultured Sulfitobacter sp.]|uniref:hypothetical protein n=1 Tax=uncultured Sulfitobacter sp. TaxID=191468 RepID=UPI002623C2DF|nr:hypothetical protein [uncultured Sulfitobacter sp.]
MVTRRTILRLGAAVLVVAGAGMVGVGGSRLWRISQGRKSYKRTVDAPDGPLNVYHLGHSLVGRDMPAMLAQLAPAGHDYASQLGWGTPLRSHWYPDVPVNGFDTENDHPKFLPAREALEGAGYDAVVLTEMVELTDAIKYHNSPEYLASWAGLARDARSDVRLYVYETWHNTDDPAGWLKRIDSDFDELWMERITLPAAGHIGAPIYVIPGGQVLAAFVRAVDAKGGVGNIDNRDALLARTPEGEVDTIHLSDLGAYLIALTHYASLYQRSPVGLPFALLRADETHADAPDAAAAALMQQVVWDVVRANPYNGFSA